ncbi:hypothetical protein GOL85_13385 [Sinorhizobium medicae]|nr:hypothetical protein [Sinorhizobium medicae]
MTKEEQFEAFWRGYPRRVAKNPCSVDGCDGETRSRGLCSSHLNRLVRYGDVNGGSGKRRHGEVVRWLQDAWSIKTKECQIWPFADDGSGYAIFALNGKYYRAHRFACEMFNGSPPSDKHEAAHDCGVSLCCNPSHLLWKTHKANIADKKRHGTALAGEAHPQSKLTRQNVEDIRRMNGILTRRRLAERYGVGISTIDNILDGVTWRDVA